MQNIDSDARMLGREADRAEAIWNMLCKTEAIYGLAGISTRFGRDLPTGQSTRAAYMARVVDEEVEAVQERIESGDGDADAEPIHPEAMRFLFARYAKHIAAVVDRRRAIIGAFTGLDALQVIGGGANFGPHGVLAHLRAEPPALPAAMPLSNAGAPDLATGASA